MTATEKQELSQFLKTAQNWVSGYTVETAETARIPVLLVDDNTKMNGEAILLLEKMLTAIELCAEDTYILEHITPSESHESRRILTEKIALFRPYIILILGKPAASCILDTKDDVQSLRGRIFTFSEVPTMVTYKPEDLLADSALKRPTWEDLKRFRSEFDRIIPQ